MLDFYTLAGAVNGARYKALPCDPGIYGLVSVAEPDRVRYVGSTTVFAYRLYQHWHSSGPVNRRATPKGLWVAALKASGDELALVVLERCEVGPRQSAVRHEKEQAHIARLAARGMCDLNVMLTPLGHANSLDSRGKELLAEVARLRKENAELRALLTAEIA